MENKVKKTLVKSFFITECYRKISFTLEGVVGENSSRDILMSAGNYLEKCFKSFLFELELLEIKDSAKMESLLADYCGKCELWWEPSVLIEQSAENNAFHISQTTNKPDIVMAYPASLTTAQLFPNSETQKIRNKFLRYCVEYDPQGNKCIVRTLAESDKRTRLVISDLKMGVSPTTYYPEIAFYVWIVTKFLYDTGYCDRFVVCGAGVLTNSGHNLLNRGIDNTLKVLQTINGNMHFIEFKTWMIKVNDFFHIQLPEILKFSKNTSDIAFSVDINKCSICEYFDCLTDSCNHISKKEQRLELIPNLSNSVASALRELNIRNLPDLLNLEMDKLKNDSKNSHLYKSLYAMGIEPLRKQIQLIISMLDGKKPHYEKKVYKSLAIPKNVEGLKKIAIQVEFDSSSHILASMTLYDLDEDITLLHEECGLNENSVFLPNRENEQSVMEKVSDKLYQLYDRHKFIHFFMWSKRDRNFMRELLKKHLDNKESFSKLADLFITPTDFDSPDRKNSEFTAAQEQQTVSSIITLLDSEIKKAYIMPVLYVYSMIGIGDCLAVPHTGLEDFEQYDSYFSMFYDFIPSEQIHCFWQAGKEKDIDKLELYRTAIKYKCSIMKACVESLYKDFAFDRLPNKASDLDYTASYGNISMEASGWLLQTKLNVCESALDALGDWRLPVHERVGKGKSAILTRIKTEDWKAIYTTDMKDKGYKEDYPKGTFVFQVDKQSCEMDVEESEFSSYCLAPEHDTDHLLHFVPGLGKQADTHPNDGYEYVYDLLSCKVIAFNEDYAVLEIWSYGDRVFRKGYNYSKYSWADRKADYWEAQCLDKIDIFSLEKISQDHLVSKLLRAYPIMFPNNLDIDALYNEVIADLEKIKKLYDDSDSRFFALDDAIDSLEKQLHRLSIKRCSVQAIKNHVDKFKSEAYAFFENNRDLAVFMSDLDHFMLYMHYDMTTPASNEKDQCATDEDVRLNHRSREIKTFCAEYCLTPPREFPADYSLSQLERDELKAKNLSDRQIEAFNAFMNNPVSLLWGPPGSGKSYTIRKFIDFFYSKAENADKKILISAANNNAVDSLCEGIPNLYRFDGFSQKLTRDHYYQNRILASTPQQIHNTYLGSKPVLNFMESFDMVIIDEAGQLPPAQLVLCLLALKENARAILVGDDLQLKPIHQYIPPEGQEEYVSSAYSYYKNRHDIVPIQLNKSFRSHPVIVEFLARIYPEFSTNKKAEEYRLDFTNENDETQDYNSSVIDVICDEQDKWNEKYNVWQIDEAMQIIKMLIQQELKSEEGTPYTLKELFTKGVAVITPFRSQKNGIRRALKNMLLEYLSKHGRQSEYVELKPILDSCVDTVHKFQGLQRRIIIVSLPTGLKESINDTLLLDPHLLNVAISRAQSKLIVMCTKNSVEWIKDRDEFSSSLFQFDNILSELVDFCGRESGSSYRTMEGKTIYRK